LSGGPAELSEVARLRALPPKERVVLKDLTREALKDHLERTLDAHMPERALKGTEQMLFAFGVVPADFNYRRAIVGLMQSELAGLYDPLDNTMYLLSDLAPEMRRATLLHELVHALQDQHYSLDRVAHFAEDQTDRMSALSSLAEGDATSVMFDAMLEPEHKTALDIPISILERQLTLASARPETADVPPVLVRSLLAPYVDGMAFVQALRERGGFAEVDRVWRAPPLTTEQLLHIERYDAHEPAVSVALPPPPEPSWQMVLHDTWGEQSLRVLFEEYVERRVARSAAMGWGGDRVATFELGGEHAVASVMTFDTEDDAREVELLFRKEAHDEPSCQPFPNGAALAASRKGRSVILTAGPYVRGTPNAKDCERSIRYNRSVSAAL